MIESLIHTVVCDVYQCRKAEQIVVVLDSQIDMQAWDRLFALLETGASGYDQIVNGLDIILSKGRTWR